MSSQKPRDSSRPVAPLASAERPPPESSKTSPAASRLKRWTSQEDAKLVELIAERQRGTGLPWEGIARQLPGRSAQSCRHHYRRALNEGGAQTKDEEDARAEEVAPVDFGRFTSTPSNEVNPPPLPAKEQEGSSGGRWTAVESAKLSELNDKRQEEFLTRAEIGRNSLGRSAGSCRAQYWNLSKKDLECERGEESDDWLAARALMRIRRSVQMPPSRYISSTHQLRWRRQKARTVVTQTRNQRKKQNEDKGRET